jgi:hypothetical protein
MPQPEALFAGFGRMLDEPRWQGLVEAERLSPSARKPTPFDSHPPTTDRVSALRALPDDGRIQDTSDARAVDLLDDAPALLAAVAGSEAHCVDHRPVDWDTLVTAAAAARNRDDAAPLVDAMYRIRRAPPVMADFFDHVEAGGMDTVLFSLPGRPRRRGPAPDPQERGGSRLISAGRRSEASDRLRHQLPVQAGAEAGRIQRGVVLAEGLGEARQRLVLERPRLLVAAECLQIQR